MLTWLREEDGFRCPRCGYFEHGYYEGDDISSLPDHCLNCGEHLLTPTKKTRGSSRFGTDYD
jgi:predicted RNA-binding Zn-ribbon protein involved in translation (DUF1610 family)